MEVILLCGGFGTRIEPVGLFLPKALLPVKGKPILDYAMNSIDALPDVERVILSTNKKFADQFEYFIKAKKAMGFKKPIEMIVEPTLSNDEKLGAIKAISYVIKRAGIKSDTMIIAGDNFYDFDLSALLKSFRAKKEATIVVYDVHTAEDAKRLGVVELKREKIVGFEEKPQNPRSTLVSTGIYLFPKKDLSLFDEYLKEGKNPDAPGHFIRWYIGQGEAHGVTCVGRWFDIGTLDTYQKVLSQTE